MRTLVKDAIDFQHKPYVYSHVLDGIHLQKAYAMLKLMITKIASYTNTTLNNLN